MKERIPSREKSCPLCLTVPPIDLLPVDDIPPRGDIIRTAVLVVEIVRMFPDIETENRDFAFGKRGILIGSAHDREARLQ